MLKRIYYLKKSKGAILQLAAIAILAFIAFFVIVAGIALMSELTGNNSGGTSGMAGGTGCYLKDEYFNATNSLNNSDEVLNKLQPTYHPNKDRIQQIIDESKKSNINPALPIAIWAGEQSFGNENWAFGYGATDSGKIPQYEGFDKQLTGVLHAINDAINNRSPYNKPPGVNTFTRLFYTYTTAMRNNYTKYGFVADEKNPRIVVLEKLVPSQVTCDTLFASVDAPLGDQQKNMACPNWHHTFVFAPLSPTDVSKAVDWSTSNMQPNQYKIYSVIDGYVEGYTPKFYSQSGGGMGGSVIWIESEDNTQMAVYAHVKMDPILSKGSKVKKNQFIGYVATRESGFFDLSPHLHFQFRNGNTWYNTAQIENTFGKKTCNI